jgi:hypothetical protein
MINHTESCGIACPLGTQDHFSLCVIRQFRCMLGPPGTNAIKDDGSVKARITEAGMKLLRGQAQEIASAFMAIRLPGVTKAYPS